MFLPIPLRPGAGEEASKKLLCFSEILCVFSSKLWLSSKPCDSQPLLRAWEGRTNSLFQVQPDVGAACSNVGCQELKVNDR